MGFPRSWTEYQKWRDRLQHRYNAGAQCNGKGVPGPTSAVTQRNRTALQRPYDSQLKKKTQSDATSEMLSRIAVDGPRPPGSPLPCPDDCPSRKFCDPSSCALESVREANAIAQRLRG